MDCGRAERHERSYRFPQAGSARAYHKTLKSTIHRTHLTPTPPQ